MENKTKIVSGVSALAVLLFVFHIIHVIHTADELSEDKMHPFKNARVTIITTDSTGKVDTMLYQDYLKKQKSP
ncbi:MAG TPA: hypothetical protein VK666_28150 [Chryseolinea sp.]|nr:hypothetical protein [Chryseolinea sp.]